MRVQIDANQNLYLQNTTLCKSASVHIVALSILYLLRDFPGL
jgi:hypothetical protein